MARLFTPTALLGAIICVAVASALAAAPVVCPRVAAPPVLDGHLDDWPALPQMVIASPDEWHPADPRYTEYGGPDDISAEVRLAWDNSALYVAIETRDDNLVRVNSASEIDRGDSVVLTASGEGSQTPSQFVVALLRNASLVWRSQPASRAGESKTIGRAIWARSEEAGGLRVTYELSIPWPDLAPLRPIPGQEFTLSVSVCDDDGRGMKGCLEQTLPVVFAADGAGLPEGPPRPASVAPSFARPDLVRFDRKAFSIRNAPTLLFGGRVDYASLPKAAWADRLDLLKAAGMNAVDVTVPWSHHQPKPGAPNLSDLSEFLDLCKQSGLLVQLALGPYAGDDWEAGGVPGWVIARTSEEGERKLVEAWYRTLLSAVKPQQLTAGGPVAAVVIRPLPDASGGTQARALQALIELVRGAGIEVPLLTANASAARQNTKRSLSNLLDTLALYRPTSAADMLPQLRALSREENGPTVVSALTGSYRDPASARRSASRVEVALAAGSTAVMLGDFAPGLQPTRVYSPDLAPDFGVVDPAGTRTAGYREMKLIGDLLRAFGPEMVSAVPAEGVVKADDPGVRAAVRLSEKMGFIFVWDEKGAGLRQVRLTYTPPGTTSAVSIPEAGAITLPAGCAKMLAMDVPVGRGLLRYSTSEVAGVHKLGDRTLLVLYGDADTPGEVALRLPGPPLVLGEVTRQRWDAERSTLILDYFHSQKDQYLLVDDLQIAILSRERAALAGQAVGESGIATISAGAAVAAGSAGPSSLEAALDCPQGATPVTVALPKQPTSITVDGKPVPFSYTAPARVAAFTINTQTFEEENRATGIGKLGRVIMGGPPKLVAAFDRGWFMPDGEAQSAPYRPAASLKGAPEGLGLSPGSFARIRASFEAAAPARLSIMGADDARLVFVNGKLVPELSGSGPEREADISALLGSASNRLEIILDLGPRADGLPGIRRNKQLPQVSITVGGATVALASWEVCSGLAGEQAGWTAADLEVAQWHYIRFGPWRTKGRELSDVAGVGWYRVPFGIARPDEWRVPYYLTLTLHGTAALYLNGNRFAECAGDGKYRLPLPPPPLAVGDNNLLAAAVYGATVETGLDSIEIAADQQQMTRRRTLVIKF